MIASCWSMESQSGSELPDASTSWTSWALTSARDLRTDFFAGGGTPGTPESLSESSSSVRSTLYHGLVSALPSVVSKGRTALTRPVPSSSSMLRPVS